jgi:hypothetical protein
MTKEQRSYNNFSNWIITGNTDYFVIYHDPDNDATWLSYPEGWGSPVRYVPDVEDPYIVAAEWETHQF